MVSVSSKNKVVVLKIDLKSRKEAAELSEFLEEQAEIWLNRENIQKGMNKLSKERKEKFQFL